MAIVRAIFLLLLLSCGLFFSFPASAQAPCGPIGTPGDASSQQYACSNDPSAKDFATAQTMAACAVVYPGGSASCVSAAEPLRTLDGGCMPHCGSYYGYANVKFGSDPQLYKMAVGPRVYFDAYCLPGQTWDEQTNSCACPVGKIRNSVTGGCMDPCMSRPDSQYSYSPAPNGSVGCLDGCQAMFFTNPDGSSTAKFIGDEPSYHCYIIMQVEDCDPGWQWSAGYCVPPPSTCKPNETKDPSTGTCKQTCPSGMSPDATGSCKADSDTCPAGQTKGPDGSCVGADSCPNGEASGSDGTCKKNADPDKDEGDDDKYFSGGDNCSSPPSCSGDEIMCGQARIQWRIDCNTRRNINISGGACGAMPVCTGEKCDALEYAQLIQQWRSACSLEQLASSASGSGDGEQPGWTRVDGMNQDPGLGETAADLQGVQDGGASLDDLDTSGFLGGMGSCPAIMTVAGGSGLGNSFAQALASPPAYFCNFIGAMAALVMLGASIVSALILTKG